MRAFGKRECCAARKKERLPRWGDLVGCLGRLLGLVRRRMGKKSEKVRERPLFFARTVAFLKKV